MAGAIALAFVLGLSLPASALTVGTASATRPDLAFTVVSTSPVYAPVDGASLVFVALRNDDASTTLSVGRSFAVTFYDASGRIVGVVNGAAALGSPASLATGLRAVPPGQLGGVSATLPGVVATSARVTNAAASGSPYSDARLPIATLPTRTSVSSTTDELGVTAVNTTGYPDRLHVVVEAEDDADSVLGIFAAPPSAPVPSGASQDVTVDYQRLPGEPAADHYVVLIEGQADGIAASSLVTPSADDTPVSGTRTTLRTQLLDGHGHGIAGQLLVLTGRAPGKAPIVLAKVKTGGGGRAALRVVIPRTGVLQVVFAGDPAHSPSGTGDFSFRLTPRLRASVTASVAGYVFHGSLPGYPGEKVAVQENLQGRWKAVKTVKADGHAGFRLTLRPTPGPHTYRAAVPSTYAHSATTSAPVTVFIR